jgi:putative hydrolase of the HAD superfamily
MTTDQGPLRRVGDSKLDIDLVSFDYWNTLIHETVPGALRDARIELLGRLLEESGYSVPRPSLVEAHAAAQAEFETVSSSGVIYETAQASFRIVETLRLPQGTIDVVEQAFIDGSASADVSAVAGARAAVEQLADAGVGLAIVCDVGLTPSPVLLRWLERHDMRAYFRATAFSDVIGEYKPGRRMFDWVLEQMAGVDPGRVVHIGDRRSTDVLGARRCGLRTIRYAGILDDSSDFDDADAVIHSYDELSTAIASITGPPNANT